ncbi:MAG: HPr family phosphocarrier protein [Oscillospiraceae bacterium]|nr:HPr family phosphocarrier protein [Oscillospiraceae bacterium]
MKFFYVLLNSIAAVKRFNSSACGEPFDIDIYSGRYIVDAKSIMGILSLDLDRPVRIEIHGTNEDGAAFYKKVESFVVDNPVSES